MITASQAIQAAEELQEVEQLLRKLARELASGTDELLIREYVDRLSPRQLAFVRFVSERGGIVSYGALMDEFGTAKQIGGVLATITRYASHELGPALVQEKMDGEWYVILPERFRSVVSEILQG